MGRISEVYLIDVILDYDDVSEKRWNRLCKFKDKDCPKRPTRKDNHRVFVSVSRCHIIRMLSPLLRDLTTVQSTDETVELIDLLIFQPGLDRSTSTPIRLTRFALWLELPKAISWSLQLVAL